MPVFESAQGTSLEPRENEVHISWAMNFAAACQDVSKLFMDTRKGRVPVVHPLFLASQVELLAAFEAIYKAGLSKAEVVKHTFVHHICDIQFYRPLLANETVITFPRIANVSKKKSGVHFGVSLEHHDKQGNPISRGYFGGVILGLQGADQKPAADSTTSPAPLLHPEGIVFDERISIKIPATAAHIWDACIRNPRIATSKSAEINVHTNIGFALSAGLPARTMNGLAILSIVTSKILKLKLASDVGRIERIACVFNSPLYIGEQDLEVVLELSQVDEKIYFQVSTSNGKIVLKNGVILLTDCIKNHKL